MLALSCSGPTPGEQTPDADLSPGSLVGTPVDFHGYSSLESLTQKSVTIRYRSTSGIDGSPTEVTGVAFVPKGDPPPNGWPIATIGHATTGSASRCAPSNNIGLLGNLTTVIPFLANGYVVVMSDYQGLGTPGPHPYLEPKTAGYNLIDAVRAAREVEPATSSDWIAYGVSQGGQAAWSANELSADYGQGLDLLGSISISPVTDLTPLVDAMVEGTLTTAQISILPSVLEGVRVAHPELDLADYLHGTLYDRADTFTTCVGEKAGLQAAIASTVSPDQYRPSTVQAADRLRGWLADFSVPSSPAPAPMLVAYGDQDQLVLPAWTVAGVTDGCALGDVIDLQVAPGQGHGTLSLGSIPVDWVEGRVADTPAPDTCVR